MAHVCSSYSLNKFTHTISEMGSTNIGVPPCYQYTFLGEEGCDSAHEFVIIVSVRLEDYQYPPISHDLYTHSQKCVLIIFLRAASIHGKRKVSTHPL